MSLLLLLNKGTASSYLEYSDTVFSESVSNNGTIGNSVSVTLSNSTFSAVGTLTLNTHYTVTGSIPTGLTLSITTSDTTHATIALSGTAVDHENVNDASITITFLSAAFVTNPVIDGTESQAFTIDFANTTYALSNAWDMDGVDEYILVPHSSSMNITNNLTVEIIAQISPTATFQRMIGRRLSNGTVVAYQAYVQDSTGYFVVDIRNGASVKTYIYQSLVVDDNVKRQYAFTFASNVLKMYVNGVEVAPAKASDNTINSLVSATLDIGIGATPNSGATPLDGKFGRVVIWDTAVLTEAELAELWNGGTPTDPLTTHGSYTSKADVKCALLMESNDTTSSNGVVDASGNGNHGTTQNMESGDLVAW